MGPLIATITGGGSPNRMSPTPTDLMRLAMEQAELAAQAGEVPVGAVIVSASGELLATGQNRRERDEDPTAHAEILALREAGRKLGTWRLEGCVMAVTLEPCPMCAGALVNARLHTCYYGTPDPKAGATGTLMNLTQDPRLNHRVQIEGPLLQEQCAEQLRAFFRIQRAMGKK